MAKNISGLPILEIFTVDSSTTTNLDKKWLEWLEDFKIYLIASGVTQDQQKGALLLHLAGKDIKEIYKTLKEEGDKFEDLCQKLTEYFQPKKNVTYERYIFKQAKQLKDESSVNYITRLRNLAKSCDFHNNEDAVRDQFISSCLSTKLREKLLQEKDVTLEKCVEHARATELSKAQAQEMKQLNNFEITSSEKEEITYQTTRKSFKAENKKKCFRCGEPFLPNHNRSCKAKGRKCYNCGKENHLSSCCRSKTRNDKPKRNRYPKRDTNNVELESDHDDTEDSEESFAVTVEAVSSVDNDKAKRKLREVTVQIEGVQTKMILDTGSTVNLIDKNTFDKICKRNKSLALKSTNSKIYPYASKPIKVLGCFQGTFENSKHISVGKVYVVNKLNAGNLLCEHTAKELRFLDVNGDTLKINKTVINNRTHGKEKITERKEIHSKSKEFNKAIVELIDEFSEIFEGRGKLKDYECKLYVDETVPPVTQKHRRYPYHLRKKIKAELERLEKEDIIERVEGLSNSAFIFFLK